MFIMTSVKFYCFWTTVTICGRNQQMFFPFFQTGVDSRRKVAVFHTFVHENKNKYKTQINQINID